MGQICAIYLRISSDIQDYQRQISDLKGFAKDNNLIFDNKHLYEDKLSGFKNEKERTGLASLLKDIVEYNIKIVLVWEMSRLARKHKYLLDLKDFFIEHSINVYFYIQRFWLLDESGKESPQAGLSIAFFGWHGEYEARLTKERFLSAKSNNVSLGKYNGGKIPFGYTLDQENHFIINSKPIESLNKSESEIVQEVFDLYESGLVCSKISRICRSKNYPKIVCNTHTLARVLRNTQYIGYKKVKLGTRPTPPLITKAQYNIVQELIESNKTKADKGKKHTYLLRGILKCAVCGEYYVGKQTDDAYICPKNSGSNKTNKGSSCSGSNISISTLDGIIWIICKSKVIYFNNQNTENLFNTNQQKINSIQGQINEFKGLIKIIESDRKKANIIFQNDGYTTDEYIAAIKKINNERDECSKTIEALEKELRFNQKILQDSNKLSQRTEKVNQITDRKQMQQIIKTIIKEIIFYKINLFKTIVIVKFIDGTKEILLFNSVTKKGNIFKKLEPSYFKFDPHLKMFYSLDIDKQIVFEAKTEYLKRKNIGIDLPSTISLQEFGRICRESNLYDFDFYETITPTPGKNYSKIYGFDDIMNVDDKSFIIETIGFEKIAYFKDLKKERFKRRRKKV